MKEAYIIYLEVDKFRPGMKFTKNPRHVTLLHWFWTDMNRDLLIDELTEVFKETGILQLEIAGQAFFGKRKDVGVNTLKHSDALHVIHNRILDELDGGIEQKNSDFTRGGYDPHITDRSGPKFKPGERIEADHACLIQAIDSQKPSLTKQVVKRWAL